MIHKLLIRDRDMQEGTIFERFHFLVFKKQYVFKKNTVEQSKNEQGDGPFLYA
jgi:hypothetical protein